MIEIKFKKTIEEAELPMLGSEFAAGFDVKAFRVLKVFKGSKEITGEKLDNIQLSFEHNGEIRMRAFERILFDTGLQLAGISGVPEDANIELQVRPRSGITLKEGIICQLGTIDSDYTGNVGLIIANMTPFLAEIRKGERLAQIIPNLIPAYKLSLTEVVEETKRGSGGFGSSGKN